MTTAEPVKILVVDDLPEKLLVYQAILEELGQDLVMARSGEEALKLVLQHEFAVILLDVNMPGLDGFETAALIRGRKKSAHTPIIFVTAFIDEVRMAEGYARGAVDFISAPVVPTILRAKVSVFVDLFRMTEQVRRHAEQQIALAAERSQRAAAEEANRRLSFLVQAGGIITRSLDQRVTTENILRVLVPEQADWAVLAMLDQGEGSATVARAEVGSARIEWGQPLSGLPPEWSAAINQAASPTGAASTATDSPGSEARMFGLPLRDRAGVFGVLLVGRSDRAPPFAQPETKIFEAIVSRSAIALVNARLYEEIEYANRQKNHFLSMLAHELRNPLAPIQSAVDLMQLSGKLDAELDWARDVINRQVAHLVRLVDDLLDVSRITLGKIRLELAPLDAAEVMTSALEISRPLIDEGGHSLTVLAPETPLLVQGDRARLAQVLANLLNNAAKYTPQGGSIVLSLGQERNEVVYRVRDTGIGIPASMLNKVFDLFTQVENSLDRSQGGLGVGLTLVRQLVEMHGGRVEVVSAGAGQGSEFTVRIPRLAGEMTTDRAARQTASNDLAWRETARSGNRSPLKAT